MKTTATIFALGAVLAISKIDARPTFPALIPNGAKVAGVTALGHKNSVGGGALNAFGTGFAGADTTWTKEFCQADSDGDGQTNGQELGDPCCAWVVGSNEKVLWTTGVSHPGDATKKSDPSLWASVSCSGSASSNSSATTAAPSATKATTTTTSPSASSSSSSTPTPTPTSAAVSTSSMAAVSVTAVTVVAALFA